MSISSFSGALVISGQQPALVGNALDYNSEAGPSLSYTGMGMLDPRFGYWGHPVAGYRALGVLGESQIPVLDVVPFTATANNIAAAQTVTAGTAMTLASTSANGVTVLSAATQILPSLNIIPSGALALDSAPTIIGYGINADIGIYNPATALARCVVVTTNGNDSSGFYTISGYDIYGYPMTFRLTGPNTTTGATTKAFKFITSIVPSGTIASTSVTVGTTDTIGFPMRADFFGNVDIFWPDTNITSNTGFIAAVATSPATSTTGDVRGTYALQTASNNVKHLQVFSTPRPSTLTNPITGMFGVTQA